MNEQSLCAEVSEWILGIYEPNTSVCMQHVYYRGAMMNKSNHTQIELLWVCCAGFYFFQVFSPVPWTHSPCLWCLCERAGRIWTSRCDWTCRNFWCCQARRLSAAHPDSPGWGLRRRSAGLEAPDVKESTRQQEPESTRERESDRE